jgi:hypothetical protein
METLGSFIAAVVVFGFIAVIIGAILSAVAAAHAKTKNFRESIAKRLKGEYLPSSILSPARIEFPVSGRKAVVEFLPAEDNQGRTRVVVPLQNTPGTLHILREGFGESFLKMFGSQDISIGDGAFDAAYVVKATPESLATQVFASHRRARVIAAVRRLENLSNATIELTRDQLRLQVREDVTYEGGIVAMVKTAEEFLEFLKLEPPTGGIELGEVKIAVDTACPVCGTTLGSLAVRCDSCRTPHHAECWKYVGQCSTYACNGKRWSA